MQKLHILCHCKASTRHDFVSTRCMKGKVYIGTSGWSYKHWREIFYPVELKPVEYLRYYCGYFTVSEINTSFYHLPRPGTVAEWMKTVPRGFRFCPKMSRFVTHIKKLNEPEVSLPRFFDVFDAYRRRLGPVLIQLPPNLAFHAEKVTAFYKALQQYKGYRFALEPRHTTWFEEESLALMRKYKIAFVIGESGKRWPTAAEVTAKHIYIRFHGQLGYDSAYSKRKLQTWANKIKQWQEAGHDVWVFFNNDGNGNALHNALALADMMQ